MLGQDPEAVRFGTVGQLRSIRRRGQAGLYLASTFVGSSALPSAFHISAEKKIIMTKAESSSSLPSSVITKLTHSTEAPAAAGCD